ncbi:acetyl-CoA carboxylase biotin carboxyl carrier protein [Shinella yambaruensis]|nr:acetyl-CoA carboxylase biotin carboxyl carrier protein [Shinella yambaruensis]MCJ8026225.1 acetyl-CoA carboxylase biotin carboxyl carrier protein [Shinella yambaruensis]MCU7981632.1 acetyl-CoA carboxylase biotin carboxyl carrier protein [Shinella yambaruensis]
MPMDNEAIKEVNAILKWINVADDVKDFYLKVGEVEISLSRNENSSFFADSKIAKESAAAPVQAVPAPPAVAPAVQPAAQAPAAYEQPAENEVVIKAPMVGTFYAASKPGAPAFVNVGDRVKSDTVLCIVEVMKLMNNVEAKVEGVITKILVENEQPVEYGQPLMVIRTN